MQVENTYSTLGPRLVRSLNSYGLIFGEFASCDTSREVSVAAFSFFVGVFFVGVFIVVSRVPLVEGSPKKMRLRPSMLGPNIFVTNYT
jgi:hypothetical protein